MKKARIVCRLLATLSVAGAGWSSASANSDPVPADPAEISSDVLSEIDVGSRPTFDCNTAKWPSKLIIATVCGNAGARAVDWELISAYWPVYATKSGPARTTFRDQHVAWMNRLSDACGEKSSSGPAACIIKNYKSRARQYREALRNDALEEALWSPGTHVALQQALIDDGYLKGNADGVFGLSTRTAIAGYQGSRGEEQSGFLTALQKARLLREEVIGADSTQDGEQKPTIEHAVTNAAGNSNVLDGHSPMCPALLQAGPAKSVAEYADASINEQGREFKDEYDLNSTFQVAVSQATKSLRTGRLADDVMLHSEIETGIGRLTPVELAACLPNFARALAGIEDRRQQQAEEQRRLENEKTQNEADEQRAAQQPKNILSRTYQHYRIVKRCYDSRDGYAVVYISDAEMERARMAAKRIEQLLQAKDTALDPERIWTESAKPGAVGMTEREQAYVALMALSDGEGAPCKHSLAQIDGILAKLDPASTIPEKDF